MRRMTLTLFNIGLLLIIGEVFILSTDATFYIEVTDKTVNNARMSLYECHAEDAHSEHAVLRKSKSTRTPVSRKSQSPTYNSDVTCEEVTDRRDKKKIYSMANFYMVVDTVLDGGKKIYLQSNGNGRRGSRTRTALGAASPTVSILVGVIIMRSMYDLPVFQDVSQDPNALQFLRSEIQNIPILANPKDEDKFNGFLLYLSIENYSTVQSPTDEDMERFQNFGEVLKHVESIYAGFVRDAKKNNVNREKSMEYEEKVATASRFLIQKLFDPCLFSGTTGMDKKAFAAASAQCDIYCKFLGAAFKTNHVTSSKCNGNKDTLVSGECNIFRCVCELESYMMRMSEPSKYFSMIECSNDLRLKTTAAILKTPALGALSSIRQSFSRSRPGSLWRSRSNSGGNSNRRSFSKNSF